MAPERRGAAGRASAASTAVPEEKEKDQDEDEPEKSRKPKAHTSATERELAAAIASALSCSCAHWHSIQTADSESMGASAAATASDGTVHDYWHHIHTSGCLPESSEQQHCRVQSQCMYVTASSCAADCCMLLRAYCTAAVTAAFTAVSSHANTKAAASTLQRNAVTDPSNTDTVRVLYDGKGAQAALASCVVTDFDVTGSCNVTFNIQERMDPPIYVYYELTNLLQNH
eukprot:6590-Heterococcus_DN1.PRE.1